MTETEAKVQGGIELARENSWDVRFAGAGRGDVARPVEKRPSRVNVLGVGVDPVTVGELHAEIKRLVESGERGTVLNVNANCLNLLYEDAALRGFFDGADLVFCDGAGVMLAARLLGGRIPSASPTPTGRGASPPSPKPRGSRSSCSVPGPAWRRGPRNNSGRCIPISTSRGRTRVLRSHARQQGERGGPAEGQRREAGHPHRRPGDAPPGTLADGEQAQA